MTLNIMSEELLQEQIGERLSEFIEELLMGVEVQPWIRGYIEEEVENLVAWIARGIVEGKRVISEGERMDEEERYAERK